MSEQLKELFAAAMRDTTRTADLERKAAKRQFSCFGNTNVDQEHIAARDAPVATSIRSIQVQWSCAMGGDVFVIPAATVPAATMPTTTAFATRYRY